MSDFGVCYRGGERIVRGEDLYRPSDGHLQYKYSPPSAAFFAFFTIFPYEAAKIIWYFVSLFLLFYILSLSYDLLPRKERSRGFVLILVFFVLAKFAGREIELGQVNILLIFLLLMMLRAMLARKDVRAGVLWGFSLIFKPYALVFFPYFVLKKRVKLIASGLGVVALGLLLPALFFGWQQNLEILKDWQKTLSRSTLPLLDHYDNASVYAFFLKNLPADSRELAMAFIVSVVLLVVFLLLAMMFVGQRKGVEKPEVLECAFLFVLVPLFSPLAWYYNYLYSVLAVVFLLNVIERFPPAMKYILIADLVAIGASLREILGKTAFRFYTQHSLVVICYLAILVYLCYSRWKNYS